MNRNSKYNIIIILLFVSVFGNISGQVPVIEMPKPASPFNMPIPCNNNPNPQIRHINPNPTVPNPHNSMDMYEQDKRELQQRNAELYKILHEHSTLYRPIQYDFPSMLGIQGTEYYQQTLEKLSGMLSGKIQLNLKDAVFAVENAYFEGQLNYSQYNKAINDLAEISQLKATQDGHNWNNRTTKNVMLFRVMSDTLDIKVPERETTITSYPMKYDFEDYMGENNWSNMFVSKLLASHKGQCHSLPLLYLILCEKTNTEAHLAYSPSHSYIKFKDNSGSWYNLELTNGSIVTDAFIVGSGYVTAEAIKNGTYLQPKTKEQVIAQCISDLALGYIDKYGYDNFITQCVDSVFKYDPNNLSALQINANYTTRRTMYVIDQLGRPPLEALKTDYPQAYALFEEMKQTYDRVDATGHRDMPKEAYENWLNSVNEEKERREDYEKNNKTIRFIK